MDGETERERERARERQREREREREGERERERWSEGGRGASLSVHAMLHHLKSCSCIEPDSAITSAHR